MAGRALAWCAGALLAATLPAQTVLFGSVTPPTLNAIPWAMTGGATSLHVYSASQLRLWGVCTGAQLLDLAVPAASSGSGTFHTSQCTLAIGHLAVNPPVPGAWTTHLDTPSIVHDGASGPYSFAWSDGVWNSLPGVAAAGFVWDGTRDIGVWLSTMSGATGPFATGTSGGLRHHVMVANASTQTPIVLDGYAMAARMVFAPGAPCASVASIGVGCAEGAFSFYESFATPAAFDLQGSAASPRVLRGTPIPAGYHVANAPSAWFAPAGVPVLANGAVPGPMQNDSFSVPLALPFAFPFPGGSTTVVHAAANGFVALGATNDTTSSIAANVGALVSQWPRLAPLWADFEPTWNLASHPDSGIYFDVDPSQQAVYVTWHKIALRTLFASGPTRFSVQCVLHANGDFEYRYGDVVLPSVAMNSGSLLVGWSQGNAQGNSAKVPDPIDISAAVPFATDGPDNARLTLESTTPILGATLTLTLSQVQNVAPIAFLMFGDTLLPGTSLAALGAPGCISYTNGNLPWASFPVALSGTMYGSGSFQVVVPDVPNLLGVSLASQALVFTANNALHLALSNGLDLHLGR